MMWPPSLLRIELKNKSRDFGLWLPIFLLWPFIILAAIVITPIVIFLAIVFWWSSWGKPMLISGPFFFTAFCALRGLEIEIRNKKKHVYLSFR